MQDTARVSLSEALRCECMNGSITLHSRGIHTHNRATALVQVTHNVAHERIGNGDIEVADRLAEINNKIANAKDNLDKE